jgi:hypothetical protein
MSDFGANVFGPGDPPAPPRRPQPEPAPAPKAQPARPEPEPSPLPPPRQPDAERNPPRRADAPRDHHPRPPHVGRRDERPHHGAGRHDAPRPEGRHQDARRHGERPPEPPRDRGDDRRREPHADRPQHGEPRPGHRPPARPAELPRAGAGAAVALLIDLAALRDEARAEGAELAQHKLRHGLAGQRPVARAIAFAAAGSSTPSGFELMPAGADFAAGVRFGAMACELLAAAPGLVLAPATPTNRDLAEALRRAGHAVELAGLTAAPEAGAVRRLGRECLFVP